MATGGTAYQPGKGGGKPAPKPKAPGRAKIGNAASRQSKNPFAGAYSHQKPAKPPKPPARPNAAYDVTQPLTGRPLKQTIDTIVKGEVNDALAPYRTEDRQLQGEQTTASNRLGAAQRAVYGQISGLAGAEPGLTSAAQSRVLAASQASGRAIGGAGQQGQDLNAQRDQTLGAVGSSGTARDEIQAEIARRQALAAGTSQAFTDFVGASGASTGNLLRSLAGTSQLRGQEMQSDVASQYGKALGKNAAAEQAVVAKAPDMREKLLTSLRQQGFNQIATQAALQQKADALGEKSKYDAGRLALGQGQLSVAQQRAAETAAHNKALERLAGTRNQIASGNLTERQRHDLQQEQNAAARVAIAQQRANQAGGVKKLKPQAQDSITGAIDTAYRFLQSYGPKVGYGTVHHLLLNGGTLHAPNGKSIHVPKARLETFANAALDLAMHGELGGTNQRRLRQYGYTVPRGWRQGSNRFSGGQNARGGN